MGVENRYHDEESTRVAKRHDAIKAENKRKKEAKEKARLEKYAQPFKVKKDSHSVQMALHDLLFDRPKAEFKTKQWLLDYRQVLETAKKIGVWDGFVSKYRLASRGLEI